ncbi:hypothetical protein Golax_020636 [Gossypium laxum]|uniref:Uncharacterized protein n=1 Tax=Gossypium laxum TaxID=34288 RepID=A0A7J9B481_9ROSI|nr:hypothetical protein [Gossypium laxum]
MSIFGLHGHVSIDLSSNSLEGSVPDYFRNISFLEVLDLRELSSLKFFDVSENELNGTFPGCFGQLESLETLNLGCNLLEGVVSETHLFNLTRLKTLVASENRLRFEPKSNWIPPFQCRIIKLGQWQLRPKFPRWLKFQKNFCFRYLRCRNFEYLAHLAFELALSISICKSFL